MPDSIHDTPLGPRDRDDREHRHEGHHHDPRGHHHHHHHHGGGADGRTGILIGAAFWINFVFFLIEAVGGLLTNSLALVADAGHMLNDIFSLGLTYLAFRLAGRSADARYTFGYRRAQALAALADAASLGIIMIFIAVEATRRLFNPPEVMALGMLGVAIAGLAANLGAAALLWTRRKTSMNIRGAFLHMSADAMGSVAAIVAAVIIHLTGWRIVDPILSLVLGAFVARGSWRLLGDSVRVLMERAPLGFPMDELADALRAVPGVARIHDLHVWQLDDGSPLASVHVVVAEDWRARHGEALTACRAALGDLFHVDHSTVQIEDEGGGECRTDCRPEAPRNTPPNAEPIGPQPD